MCKRLSWGLLSLLLISSVSVHAQSIISGLDFLSPGSTFECPPIEEFKLENVVDPPVAGLEQLKSMSNNCDKFIALAHFVWYAETGGYDYYAEEYGVNVRALTQEAHFQGIRTLSEMRRLGGKKDNIEIINQSNDFLDKYGHDNGYSFAVHYYLVSAVKRSVRPSYNDQTYTLMAIGEHPRQREFLVQPVMQIENGEVVITEERTPNDQGPNRYSPKMYNMSYMSFVERYDSQSLNANNRSLVENVKEWYNEAAQTYAESFLERGDFLLVNNEPFAAAYWYTLLTRRPPVTLANGETDYTAYDVAVERIALSYVVASQNFARVRPDTDFLGRPGERLLNDALWGLGSNWVRATNEDIGDWLGLDGDYDPNDPSQMQRPEMAEMTFCSAMTVAQNAQGDRPASEVSANLRDLEARLNQKKLVIEQAIGRRISCN